MKKALFTLLGFISWGCISAQINSQDTIKVGVNNQHISVTPPLMNQKVSIKIEDSTFNYIIDISKVSNDLASLEEATANTPIRKSIRQRNPYEYTRSGLFREFEFGTVTTPLFGPTIQGSDFDFFEFINDSLFLGNEFFGEQNRITFDPNGVNVGLYLDATIREKYRKTKRWENVSFHNSHHLRLSVHNYGGTLTEEVYYVSENGSTDSIISNSVSNAEIWNTQLQIAKRFTLLWELPKIKDFTFEYGIYTGIRLNLTKAVTEQLPGSEVTTSGSDAELDIYSDNPFIRLNHQIGFNYKNVSLNTNVSFATLRHGTFNTTHRRGNRIAVGVAYRF